MTDRKLSVLGFLMECLNVQSSALAREIHVDASLISRWKCGSRCFRPESDYFDPTVRYFMEESRKMGHYVLVKALGEIYPEESLNSEEEIESVLRRLMSQSQTECFFQEPSDHLDKNKTLNIGMYDNNEGRREAAMKILKYAESMEVPGEFIFINSDDHRWLLEDEKFAQQFAKRLQKLLDAGFKAKLVIHFSSYRDRLIRFFEFFNSVIFHQNAKWYYYEYFDENIYQFMQFVLCKTVALVGISAGKTSSTIVFTDKTNVIRQWVMAQNVIHNCQEVFVTFTNDMALKVVDYVRIIRKRGTLYSLLPIPAFISTSPELLKKILKKNDVSEEKIIQCMEINAKIRTMAYSQYNGLDDQPVNIVRIFQIEELEKRIDMKQIRSRSLSHICSKDIVIEKSEYAMAIRDLVANLKTYENLEIVLITENDNVILPDLIETNLWCKQNTWLIQMDQNGFRLSDEISIVNALSIYLEKCVRKIPPRRKERESVINTLLTYAENLERRK